MSWLSRLQSSFRRGRFESGLDEELAFHVEMRTAEYAAGGLGEDEARARILRKFGNRGLLREKLRDADTFPWLHDFAQDVRYALRTLRKTPGFTFIALAILTLGLGANTAMFSVIRAVLLRPLPFREPDRLVQMLSITRKTGATLVWVNHRDALDWQQRSRSFEGIAAYHFAVLNLSDGANPESIYGITASANLFSVLGVQPEVGRTFLPGEDQDGHDRVVVISDALWHRCFHADPNVVGSTVQLGRKAYTLIGVMPANFNFPVRLTNASVMPSTQMSFWVPLYIPPAQDTRAAGGGYGAVARLKPGVTLGQANSEMDGISSQLEREYPATNGGFGTGVISLARNAEGDTRPALLVLLAATSLVVLTACANLASLLLARSAARKKELAVRNALGASGARLLRQSLSESLVLATIGTLCGVALAFVSRGLLVRLSPHSITRIEQTRIDGTVLLFAAGLAVLTSILFGLMPAIQAARTGANNALRENGPRTSGSVAASRTRAVLIAGEVAVALVLTVGAGLLARSFARLLSVDSGIRRDRLLTAVVVLPDYYKGLAARCGFYRRAVERLNHVPGVAAATSGANLEFAGQASKPPVYRKDEVLPVAAGAQPTMELDGVGGDYLNVMGIRLLRGRDFTRDEEQRQRPVGVLSESAVRRMWPDYPRGKDPLAQQVCFRNPQETCVEVVGIAADTHLAGLDTDASATLYVPISLSGLDPDFLFVRTAGPPLAMAPSLRHEVAAIDPNQGVFLTAAVDDMLSESIGTRRFSVLLLSAFGALGLILAAVGIYGMVSYSVARRTREIGVRVALGASSMDICRMVAGQGVLVTLAGVAVGLPAAFALTRLLTSLLFGVSVRDPAVFALTPAVFLAVAVTACLVPTRRALRVDPTEALRAE